jgi:hypothetical protein
MINVPSTDNKRKYFLQAQRYPGILYSFVRFRNFNLTIVQHVTAWFEKNTL